MADGFGRDTLVGWEQAVTGDEHNDNQQRLNLSDGGASKDGTLISMAAPVSNMCACSNLLRQSPVRRIFPTAAIDFSAGKWVYVAVTDLDGVLDGNQAGADPSQTFASDFDGFAVAGNGFGAAGKAEYLDTNGDSVG